MSIAINVNLIRVNNVVLFSLSTSNAQSVMGSIHIKLVRREEDLRAWVITLTTLAEADLLRTIGDEKVELEFQADQVDGLIRDFVAANQDGPGGPELSRPENQEQQ